MVRARRDEKKPELSLLKQEGLAIVHLRRKNKPDRLA